MSETPRHIGIILDGNRRYAKKRGLPTLAGHRKGFDNMKNLFKWCKELDIKELSLYCFSMQNFNRSKEEVDYLMNIFADAAKEALKNKDVHENKIRINVLGRLHLFPEKVIKPMEEVMEKTKAYDQHTVNFCLGYGGREEIVDGIKKLVRDAKDGKIKEEDISVETFYPYLYTQSEPDLIIRTSGEQRTSNFLMWHQAYSEWMFVKKHWPEFSKEDLMECIREFAETRQRRFGK